MVDYTKLNPLSESATVAGFDAGLRSFMLKVYNYMTLALVVSGAVAYFAGTSEAFIGLLAENKILMYAIMFAPLAVVLFFSVRIGKMSLQSTQGVFWLFSVLMGLSLWFIFAVYTQASIVKTFFITAATFGGMSLYGYTTKRDLTGMGHFLIMGVFGIIIASIVNIFLQSSGLEFAISIIGLGIFIGLTAYDTQKLKTTYYMAGGNPEIAGKYAISGALSLYLDFINIFIFLLRFMGDRR